MQSRVPKLLKAVIYFLCFFWQRDLRELCEDRIHFYQSLQESELKMQHSATKQ